VTGAPITFRTLTVERLPWMDGGFELGGLSPGINIVYGPNASGKTTTALVLQALLWPAACGIRGATLAGTFDHEGLSWRIGWDMDRVEVLRDGSPGEPPSLPGADIRQCYYLPLEELLQAEDEEFAARLLRVATGGYDVQAAAGVLGFRPSATGHRTRPAELRKAQETLHRGQREQERLLLQESRLEELRARRDGARKAAARLGQLKQARDIRELDVRIAELNARLEDFPREMETLRGDEPERLDEIEEKIERHVEHERKLQEEIAGLREGRKRLPFPGEGPPPGILPGLRKALDGLRDRADRTRQAGENLAVAEAELQGEIRALDQAGEAERWKEVTVPDLEALEDLLKEAEGWGAKQAILERIKPLLREEGEPERPELLREGARALARWLALVEEPRPWSWVPLVTGAASLAAAGLFLLLSRWEAAVLGTVLGLVLLGWEGWRRKGTAARAAQARFVREAFEKTGLTPPAGWTAVEAAARLDALQEEIGRAQAGQTKRDLWRGFNLEPERLEEDRRRLEGERARVAALLGFAPDTGEVRLHAAAKAVDRLRKLVGRVAAAEAELAEAEGDRTAAVEEVGERLEPFGYDRETSAEALAGQIEDLDDKVREFQSIVSTLEGKEIALRESLRPEQEERRAERAALFEAVGIAADRPALEALADRFEEYRAIRSDLGDAQVQRSGRAETYEGPAEDLERPRTEIEEEIAELREEAAKFEDLHEEIARIDQDVRQARKRFEITDALAELEERRETLRRLRGEDYQRIAGAALARWLEGAIRLDEMPPLFQRAQDLFARFTREGFELRLSSDGGARFQARDTCRDRIVSLEHLSSGTRVQLLLAVRLAFLEHQETSARPPLVLDEVLANSDDDRTRAVIGSVADICRQGRQVFAFTAQHEEVAKWEAVLAELEAEGRGAPFRRFDLGEIRDLARVERIPLVPEAILAGRPLPEPAGLSREEYAEKIGVDGIDPWDEGVHGVHLWHLVEDTALLHRILRAGIERWGPLELLMRRGDAAAALGVPGEDLAQIEGATETLREICRCWRVGRGRSVDREVLEASGAVSPTFLDRLTDLTRSFDGDARRLIEALAEGRVERFHASKREVLEDHLRAEGYLPREEPLEAGEVRARVLAAAAPAMAQGLVSLPQIDRLLGQVFERDED